MQQLLRSIKEKECELECPVCQETAEIYSCPEQHLLCSSCRPRVAECTKDQDQLLYVDIIFYVLLKVDQ